MSDDKMEELLDILARTTKARLLLVQGNLPEHHPDHVPLDSPWTQEALEAELAEATEELRALADG